MSHAVRTGQCLCGKISYQFTGDPVAVILCHCLDCQHTTGSAFSLNALIARNVLTIEGSPKVYQTTGSENGNTRDRAFCENCGTSIFTFFHEQPGLAAIKVGTLDDATGIEPAVEIWCRRAMNWISKASARVKFEGDPQ